jgi:hypothetical protein
VRVHDVFVDVTASQFGRADVEIRPAGTMHSTSWYWTESDRQFECAQDFAAQLRQSGGPPHQIPGWTWNDDLL